MRRTITLIMLLGPPAVLAIALLSLPAGPSRFAPYLEVFLAGLLVFWMLVSIPFGIMVAIDWLRSPRPTGRLAAVVRNMLRVPVFLLGASAILIGISILAWVAYNLLWERRATFRNPGSLGLPLMMIGFGAYLFRLALGLERQDAEGQADAASVGSDGDTQPSGG
jgi:hypothetical protein